MVGKPRKYRGNSGDETSRISRKIANTLLIPCIPRATGKLHLLHQGAETAVPEARLAAEATRLRRPSLPTTRGHRATIGCEKQRYTILGCGWRSGRDSNPRDGSPSAPLAGVCLRPLGHHSADPFNDSNCWEQVENPKALHHLDENPGAVHTRNDGILHTHQRAPCDQTRWRTAMRLWKKLVSLTPGDILSVSFPPRP